MLIHREKCGKKRKRRRKREAVFGKKEIIMRLIFSVALSMNNCGNLIIILRSVSYEKNEAQQFKAERRFP